jgi:hypothetical protein
MIGIYVLIVICLIIINACLIVITTPETEDIPRILEGINITGFILLSEVNSNISKLSIIVLLLIMNATTWRNINITKKWIV